MVLTNVGQSLMVKNLAAVTPLKITKCIYGDGEVADGTDFKAITAMVSPKMTLPMVSQKVVGNGTAEISLLQDNSNVAAPGFAIREIGVYAQDGDSEILYSYAYYGNQYTWMPSPGGAETIYNLLKLDIVIGRTTQLDVNITTDLAFAPEVDFQAHITAANHPYIGADVTTADKFWACGTDGKMHAMTLPNVQTTIIGDSDSSIPTLRNRVNQLETNQDNILLAMLAANEVPDMPLTIYEDFANPDMVDLYDVQVLSAVAGSGDIDITTNNGVIQGAWYWISDGIHSEYIQIKSVIKNGTVYRVRTNQDLVYTYDLPSTRLYRSTSLISGSVAYGSGDRKGQIWTAPDMTWKGTGTDTAGTVALETTQAKASDYDIEEGSAAFTVDGFITFGGDN